MTAALGEPAGQRAMTAALVEPAGQRPSAMTAALVAVAAGAKGFLPTEEAAALHHAALVAGSEARGPTLEVGAYCGKSAVWLGAAARAMGSLVFSVDHHRGSEENQPGWQFHDPDLVDPGSGRIDTLPWWRRTIAAAGLEDVVVAVVGESATVGGAWGRPLGLLFIDGGHGDEVVRADERAWLAHVASGGLVAIHDVFPDPADGGRPPYELYRRLLDGSKFSEEAALGEGSLRVLRRVG